MAFSFRLDPKHVGITEHPATEENHQRYVNGLPKVMLTNLLRSSSLGDSQTHAQYGIGSQIALVLRSVKFDEELIDLGLILDVKVLLDELRTNDVVDILDGFQDALSSPLRLVAVTKFACFSSTWD